ncbi:hypothetical protein E7681_02935 [Thalassobius vesicularis]|uniref:Mitochondrial inner membrane protein n=1 Tax=Thalassobius vesicularis TaxID=1294297 RepID=A0A4S3MD60_9RHOB|nr:hypothetical protein [Thalassobius vesicularis]THD76809.1 hypothetical protein E7681_02935 [Thalassobius vesicularis]
MSDPDKDKKTPEVPVEDVTENDPQEIQDAVIVEEEPEGEPHDSDEAEGDDQEEDIVDAIIEDTPEEVAELEPEPVAQPASTPAEAPKRSGFLPLVLGGIVAAGLGVGGARVMFPDGWPGTGDSAALETLTAQLAKQTQLVGALEKRLAAQEDKPAPQADLTPVTNAVDALRAEAADLGAKLAALDTRLTELEKRPSEGGANAAAVEAYEREVKALRDAMEKQKSEVDALVAAAEEDKASAEVTAQQAMIRSAVSRIRIAMDTGAEFTDALSDLKSAGVAVPGALTEAAENGIATMAQLSADFPAAARKALNASRKAAGDGGNVWNFLRNQLGMRSLEPKEGTDPDAVLSRAESALADGRLNDALAELDVLPEEGRVELTDWMAAATRRAEAVAAAEDLSAQVASN